MDSNKTGPLGPGAFRAEPCGQHHYRHALEPRGSQPVVRSRCEKTPGIVILGIADKMSSEQLAPIFAGIAGFVLGGINKRPSTPETDSTPDVNGNRKPHIYGNRKLHTSGEDVSGGADILPVMPVGRVGLDAGSGATGVLANTRREAAEPAVTWRLPHAVRPTLSSASADAPASGSCCPGC